MRKSREKMRKEFEASREKMKKEMEKNRIYIQKIDKEKNATTTGKSAYGNGKSKIAIFCRFR